MADANENLLGAYLKDRRTKLDPAALGFSTARRRTPGLRREEVAQRAHVSATWYTWLEQGRGGAPSAEVLERIARALMLTDVEREYVFLLGLGRAPGLSGHAEPRDDAADSALLRLQHVLDSMEFSPAVVRTSTWDIVAWNRAALVTLTDYEVFPPEQRNVLRRIFFDPAVRAAQPDWNRVARFAVAAFRADTVRAGTTQKVQALVDELHRLSPEFAAIWRDNDVRAHDSSTKQIQHPVVGPIALEYSVFAVHGHPDLSLVTYTPATPADVERIKLLIARRANNVVSMEDAA
ncbi:helix-turn-helix transcriptional regulator [Paraburkholderia megapolitana]|uniref:helix-turn-helix transcriptional regulator n=1 Tax=Paraburkholderia megapolitana TaxID=420953 RepID=UPI0038BA218C